MLDVCELEVWYNCDGQPPSYWRSIKDQLFLFYWLKNLLFFNVSTQGISSYSGI